MVRKPAQRRQRNRAEQQEASEISRDQNRAAAHPVYPYAREQAHQNKGHEADSDSARPSADELAFKTSTAVSGSARLVICDPNTEIVCPTQNLRNSGLRASWVGGAIRLHPFR